jgi:DNA-binding transcriptional regulator YdaS (Cro superfamily)
MPPAMEQQPRWAEMCARILQQCESIRGGRESLAEFLGVHPTEVAYWVAGRSGGPSREVFERAVGLILEEHDRRAQLLERTGQVPRRRKSDAS